MGRVLDDCHTYGCDLLFAEASAHICKQEAVDTKFHSLDTTAFALTGEYDVDSDEHTIGRTENKWNGNASDTKIFRERAKALASNFKAKESPRYLIADSKLYDAKTT